MVLESEQEGLVFDENPLGAKSYVSDEEKTLTELEWNEWWNKQKEENHNRNMDMLDRIFYKGTYYRNGKGQKGR